MIMGVWYQFDLNVQESWKMQDNFWIDEVFLMLDKELLQVLECLMDFLCILLILIDLVYKGDVCVVVDWLCVEFLGLGFQVLVCDMFGYLMVVVYLFKGQCCSLLFYGYYDVQLVDLLNLWDCLFFQFELQDMFVGCVICVCGVVDDKGQLMIFVEVFWVWKIVYGSLFIDLVLLFEGEEELGLFSL